MAIVSITSPQSAFLNANNAQNLVKWTNQRSGQTAYEILYKLKSADSWSTLGKVASTTPQADLNGIFTAIGRKDIQELYYRILVYYSWTEGNDQITGSEYTDAYRVIFNIGGEGKLSVWDGDTARRFTVYSNDSKASPSLKVNTSKGIKKIPIVDSESPLKGKVKIQTPSGTRFLASESASFQPTNIYGNGSFNRYVTTYASKQESQLDGYSRYTKYKSVSNIDYYARYTAYSYRYDKTTVDYYNTNIVYAYDTTIDYYNRYTVYRYDSYINTAAYYYAYNSSTPTSYSYSSAPHCYYYYYYGYKYTRDMYYTRGYYGINNTYYYNITYYYGYSPGYGGGSYSTNYYSYYYFASPSYGQPYSWTFNYYLSSHLVFVYSYRSVGSPSSTFSIYSRWSSTLAQYYEYRFSGDYYYYRYNYRTSFLLYYFRNGYESYYYYSSPSSYVGYGYVAPTYKYKSYISSYYDQPVYKYFSRVVYQYYSAIYKYYKYDYVSSYYDKPFYKYYYAVDSYYDQPLYRYYYSQYINQQYAYNYSTYR